jgi:hypothetical protein
MPISGEKLQLNENHRRVISILLRRVEKTCDGVLDWLDRKPGLLNRLRDDLTSEQQAQFQELINRLYKEIRRFDSEVALDPAVKSRRRAIAALLSTAQIDLEEGGATGFFLEIWSAR